MSENPYDNTVWDPIDPEQAIEDPMHGSEALMGLLAIPPMRLADGTFYVFGASYICRTNTFDADGVPFIRFMTSKSTMEMMREVAAHTEWIDAFQNGTLPPREEMGLPEFKYNQPPYFIVGDK